MPHYTPSALVWIMALRYRSCPRPRGGPRSCPPPAWRSRPSVRGRDSHCSILWRGGLAGLIVGLSGQKVGISVVRIRLRRRREGITRLCEQLLLLLPLGSLRLLAV